MGYHFLTVSTRHAWHHGLRTWLLDHSLAATIDAADDGAQAVADVDAIRPDVIVIDDPLAGMSVRQFAAEVRDRNASAQIVVVGDVRGAAMRLDMEAGIGGFVSAGAEASILLAALSAVLDGRTYVDPSLAGDLLAAPDSECPSPRELQILDLVVAGHQNKVIAQLLGIGHETVKTHVSALMRKWGVTSRTELAIQAVQRSFVRLPVAA